MIEFLSAIYGELSEVPLTMTMSNTIANATEKDHTTEDDKDTNDNEEDDCERASYYAHALEVYMQKRGRRQRKLALKYPARSAHAKTRPRKKGRFIKNPLQF